MATGLPARHPIQTYWGDARQFVELHQNTKKYDLVFGDAFNDFSVPWHLTTREFNEKIKKMLTPNGVYMINIIDVYESDAEAEKKAEKEIEEERRHGRGRSRNAIRSKHWRTPIATADSSAPGPRPPSHLQPRLYLRDRRQPGQGLRETFVVVASMQPLDLADLGNRADDPQFLQREAATKPKPYTPRTRITPSRTASRNIILTDDYAPVENLLAPVAETRGTE